jgi:TetR/AcrR family transcriptional repressor of mexJK operon
MSIGNLARMASTLLPHGAQGDRQRTGKAKAVSARGATASGSGTPPMKCEKQKHGSLMGGKAGTRAVVTGRPRQMLETERRRQLIAAAADLFLYKGYHATTMDDVARCAGMSKKTVYQVFSSKSELFDGLLSDWFAPFTAPIEADDQPPRQVLTDALSRLANFALSECQIRLTRLLIAETACSEEIATALDRQCVGRGKGALEQWLAAQAARGVLKIDNPKETANMLFFAAAGDFQMGLLLRTRPRPAAEEIAARIEHTVAAFFRQLG